MTMDPVSLGASGLRVSPIAFGTWQLSRAWGGFDEREATAAIRCARERGVNFFDTAQAYGFGEAERALGRVLRDDLDYRRDEVVIATKGGVRIDEDGARVRDSIPQWPRDPGQSRGARRHRRLAQSEAHRRIARSDRDHAHA
jgi:hypothetical protein